MVYLCASTGPVLSMRPIAALLAVAALVSACRAQQTGLLYNAGVAQCVSLDASFQPCTSAPSWVWANGTAFRTAAGAVRYLSAPPATCTFGSFMTAATAVDGDAVYATGPALRTPACPGYCLQASSFITFGACNPSLASQQWTFPYAVPPPPGPPGPPFPPTVVMAVGAPLVQLTYPSVGAWENAGWIGGAVAVAALGARTDADTPALGPLLLPAITLEGALTVSMRVRVWAPGELWTFTSAAAAPIMVATATPTGLVVAYGQPPAAGSSFSSQTATTCGVAWGAQPAHLAAVITGTQPVIYLNGAALACATAPTSGTILIYPTGGFEPSTRYKNATLLRTAGAAVSEFRIDAGALSAATIAGLSGRTMAPGMPPYVPVPQLPAASALPVMGVAASSADATESPLATNMSWSGGQFFSTTFELGPWVRVDLGGLASVAGVAVAWRADGCLSCNAGNLTIYAGASTDFRNNGACGMVAPTGVTTTPCNATARYVTIVGVTTVVQLRAVRVFGVAAPPQPVLPSMFTLTNSAGQCIGTGCALMTLTDGLFTELATGTTHAWVPIAAAGGGMQLLSGPPGGPFYATAVSPAGAASALAIPQPQALSSWYSAATWGAGEWRDAITNASVVAPPTTTVLRSVSVSELSSPISYVYGGTFALPTSLPSNFTICTVSRQVSHVIII